MKKILIYGLGQVFNTYKIIFENEIALGAKIVGYSDKMIKKVQPFFGPDEISNLVIDEVVVTCNSYEEIREELVAKQVTCNIVHYWKYLHDNWNIDLRAVKFLDKTFIDDLIMCRKILGRAPKNFVEIGANFAQDAVLVKKVFGIRDEDIYVFEPHPDIMDVIKKKYNFNFFQNAVSCFNGEANFHMCKIDKLVNNGMSSLKDSSRYNEDYKTVKVNAVTMEEMINRKEVIEAIDLVKIDVEGNTYEVLKGFGDKIRKVKIIQCEGDYFPLWEGEVLFGDIFTFLWEEGFRMVNFHITDDKRETDSLWVNNDILNNCE